MARFTFGGKRTTLASRLSSSALLLLVLSAAASAAEDWPQYRGPRGQGVSAERGLPVKWGAGGGVRWKTALPGPGHSSPVVWGERIFLTAYRAPAGGARGQLLVVALDKRTGRVLWEREVRAERIEEVHPTNAPATPTPATDGRRVYVFFGSYGLVSFDFDGRKVWEKPLGPYPVEWGTAASPILHGALLLLNCNTDGEDFLLAVDKETGRTVWKTSHPPTERSFTTPVVWEAGGREQVVVSGSGHVKGYDVRTGRELWSVGGVPKWIAPSPVTAHGLLYAASNSQPNFVMAIRPGGAGDVTATHVAWRYDRSVIGAASPVVVGDYLFAVRDGGVMTCLDAKTGALRWQERLPAGGPYFASPVAAGGHVYVVNEEGEVTVVAAKPTYELVATNRMGERTMASPAISDGRLLIRTDKHLFSIARE
ncbi:MAG TPA: PQQ-binding-like beta-propeller repeat protein [Pyrinomonadaceae bacterium]|nr:PQQ-binding-like beta-propeller repeat protein [Pyrinomonadaceae bacterium]